MQIMPNCISARWHPLFVMFLPKEEQNKMELISFDFYHIDRNETMAFGDGGNDIEMLQHVALSVAMEIGNDKVKRNCRLCDCRCRRR